MPTEALLDLAKAATMRVCLLHIVKACVAQERLRLEQLGGDTAEEPGNEH